MANAVGVSGEQLAAQIATIESVTREAPEQIGNGLKTLYARFSDIASGKEDEDGFTLGKVTSELQKIGVQVLDSMGQIRDVGDIMEDLMVIWDDLDQTSKVAASQALAGKYQVNRFMALMDNTDMYQEYKGATGEAATGTLDQMNQEYADSLAGRVQKLQTTMEGIFSNIFNTDSFYPFIEVAQKALDIIDNLTESIGGGIPVLTTIGSLFARIFSKNIAQEITNTHFNDLVQDQRSKNLENKQAALSNLGVINPDPNNVNSQAILDYVDKLNKLQPNLSQEQ
jgi:TP901 family phage tail tape measure protein